MFIRKWAAPVQDGLVTTNANTSPAPVALATIKEPATVRKIVFALAKGPLICVHKSKQQATVITFFPSQPSTIKK